MLTWEFDVLNWIQINLHSPFADRAMVFITHLGDKGLVWVLLAVILIANRKTRRSGIAVALGLVLVLVCCNLVLKPFVARARPCDLNAAIDLLIARPGDASFPSGHTASSFAAVGALYFNRWRFWPLAAALACLIAFSRLYLYVHFPSDVLAGALLGFFLGSAGVLLAKKAAIKSA